MKSIRNKAYVLVGIMLCAILATGILQGFAEAIPHTYRRGMLAWEGPNDGANANSAGKQSFADENPEDDGADFEKQDSTGVESASDGQDGVGEEPEESGARECVITVEIDDDPLELTDGVYIVPAKSKIRMTVEGVSQEELSNARIYVKSLDDSGKDDNAEQEITDRCTVIGNSIGFPPVTLSPGTLFAIVIESENNVLTEVKFAMAAVEPIFINLEAGDEATHYSVKDKTLVLDPDSKVYTLVVTTSPGARVRAFDSSEKEITNGTANESGRIEIALEPALLTGDALNFVADKQGAGNCTVSVRLLNLKLNVQSLNDGESENSSVFSEGTRVMVTPAFELPLVEDTSVELMYASGNSICSGNVEASESGYSAVIMLPCLRADERDSDGRYVLQLVRANGEPYSIGGVTVAQSFVMRPNEKLSLSDVRMDVTAEVAGDAIAFASTNAVDGGQLPPVNVNEDGFRYYDITDASNLAIILNSFGDSHYFCIDTVPGFVEAQIEEETTPVSPMDGRITWIPGDGSLDTLIGDNTLVISTGGRTDAIFLYLHRDEREPEPLQASLAEDQPGVIAPDTASIRLSIDRDCLATVDYGDGGATESAELTVVDGRAELALNSDRLISGRIVTISLNEQDMPGQKIDLALKVQAMLDNLLVFDAVDGVEAEGDRWLPIEKDGDTEFALLLLSASPVERLEAKLGDKVLEAVPDETKPATGVDAALHYKDLTAVDSVKYYTLHIGAEDLADAAEMVEIIDDRQAVKLSFTGDGNPLNLWSNGQVIGETILSRDATRSAIAPSMMIVICISFLVFIVSLIVFIVSTAKLRKVNG